MTHGLFVSTERMTGFTHVHSPLVSDHSSVFQAHDRIYLWVFSYYSQVQKCMAGVTSEYFQLISNCSQAVSFLCCTSPTHELPSNFQAWSVTRVFLQTGMWVVVYVVPARFIACKIIIKWLYSCSFILSVISYKPTY